MASEIRKRSDKQEKEGARRWQGKQHAGSGSGAFKRNDWHTKTHLIEAKRTDNLKSITLKADDLQQVEHQALIEGRIPVLQFELGKKRYVVLLEDDYLEGLP